MTKEKNCKPQTVSSAVATNSVGCGVVLLSLLFLIIFSILKENSYLGITDLQFWIVLFMVMTGGILAIIGGSITKACMTKKFTDLLDEEL